ncbi:MAG: DUF4097 family beta strand repeat-containing protein [bacterium]|nr:DUF4097 family beta strand repeat-containing protein [bacterium]
MKKVLFPLFLLFIALLSAGCFERFPAKYSESVELSVALPAGGTLHVSTLNGAVSVQSGEVQEVKVTAQKTVRSRTEEEARKFCEETKIETQTDASETTVSVVLPQDYQGRANIGVSISAIVPRTCNLDLRTSNGRVESREIDGDVELRTSNGGVDVLKVKGGAVMRSTNGAITGEDIAGRVLAETTNGGIELAKVSGDVEALTSNGRITIGDVGGDIRCRTSNGGIELSNVVRSADAVTSNGSVTCRVPKDVSAKVSAMTSNGKARCDFPLAIRHGRFSGKLGDGEHTIELETSNGNISLEKMP